MKQAKTEAAGVVETYKAEKLAEFRAKESGSSLSTENAALEKKTEAEIAAMRVTFEKNKQVMISLLRKIENPGSNPQQILTVAVGILFCNIRCAFAGRYSDDFGPCDECKARILGR